MDNQPQRVYERVFSEDRKSCNNKLVLSDIKAVGMEREEYENLFQTFLVSMFQRVFDDAVRLSWLRRVFVYRNTQVSHPLFRNLQRVNVIFAKFVRRIIGRDIQIITKSKYFTKLETYFEEFFPGFTEGNPFTNPDYYKFPYKNITVDFLLTVHQLDDRLKLLKEADEQKMSYAVFADHVIEFVSLENEKLDLPKPRYELILNKDRYFPFFVRDNQKDIYRTKKGKKRIWPN